ncbi:helix-turn-helix domain-containing protein [Oleisolibacter albus]|uniref:helix-turn-helix domain-containing protein n=1 Tax=Oleisolibacter albus TaxID=2171757 RepID=UPI000DF364B2|nr:helix-turn-helix transcriptional regulator [Oleisolibacter albus]
MSGKIYAGERVRRLREAQGLSQAALAQAIALSSSYLNQIENNQRPLSAAAVIRLSSYFGVEPTHFADEQDLRLATELREVLGDPLFAEAGTSAAAIRDMVRASPMMASHFMALYRAYQALDEEYRGLREAVGDLGTGPGTGEAAQFPYDEVRDFFQDRRNHFEQLDIAAEMLFTRERFSPAGMLEDLTRYLQARHGVTVETEGTLAQQGVLWRFDAAMGMLSVADTAPRESRAFYLAHQIALLDQGEAIAREVERSGLGSAEARALLRRGLANYFAGALILPYRLFLAEAKRLRYDIEQLQSQFHTSFEQVCHRLSTMQRPGLPGVPFYFVKVDMAGNMSKRSSATRFQFARFGGACPLWNVHQAFAQPGRILVQLAQTPDGVTYLCIARTITASGGGYLSRPREAAVGLGCEISYADQLVYAAGLDLKDMNTAVPIGSSCRICDREDCRHRAFPPVGRRLMVDGRERRQVPYSVVRR